MIYYLSVECESTNLHLFYVGLLVQIVIGLAYVNSQCAVVCRQRGQIPVGSAPGAEPNIVQTIIYSI